ncbi:hypothetical protein JB92DRAFT_1913586 [Gautieria morchelliformis]|nr:hypothetical protein JB92DRAFT_1913586 [Gautieria morchelliformis]
MIDLYRMFEHFPLATGQRSEDREPENERDAENDLDDDASLPDADSAVPRTRLRTPESPGSLYTLREDTTTSTATLAHRGLHHYEYQGHSRSASYSSSEGDPSSSTDSTPPRAPSLPLQTVPLGILAPRRPRTRMRSPSREGLLALASASASASVSESGSASPFTAHAPPAGTFVSSPAASPEPTVPTHSNIFGPPSFPPPYSLSLPYVDTDLDVGIYTTASHTHRHRHRSSSFPGLVAAVNAFALGAEEGAREAV